MGPINNNVNFEDWVMVDSPEEEEWVLLENNEPQAEVQSIASPQAKQALLMAVIPNIAIEIFGKGETITNLTLDTYEISRDIATTVATVGNKAIQNIAWTVTPQNKYQTAASMVVWYPAKGIFALYGTPMVFSALKTGAMWVTGGSFLGKAFANAFALSALESGVYYGAIVAGGAASVGVIAAANLAGRYVFKIGSDESNMSSKTSQVISIEDVSDRALLGNGKEIEEAIELKNPTAKKLFLTYGSFSQGLPVDEAAIKEAFERVVISDNDGMEIPESDLKGFQKWMVRNLDSIKRGLRETKVSEAEIETMTAYINNVAN